MTALSFALSYLVYEPCFLCPTPVAIRVTSSRWISSKTIFLLLFVDSLDRKHCGWRPTPAFPFAAVPIISHLRGRFCILYIYFRLPFPTSYYRRLVFFTRVSRESCSIWKSHSLPNLNSSTSDNIGSFCFIDELYRTTFVKELGTPKHLFCIFTDEPL